MPGLGGEGDQEDCATRLQPDRHRLHSQSTTVRCDVSSRAFGGPAPARVTTLADALPLLAEQIALPRTAPSSPAPSAAPPPAASSGRAVRVAHVELLISTRLGAKPSSADGRYWMARCPWHDDRHPSLSIDIVTQRCRCFACGRTGMIAEAVRGC